jgi:aryl-alcohol dehydrogenase-like predicted oxidoreductase
MNYRRLGKTGLDVSEIGLGMWPAGGSIFLGGMPTGYGRVPETEAMRAIGRALDLGVNFFDTSDSYGLGRSERILGRAVGSRRGQAILATKAGFVPDGSERWLKDLSADHLRAAAERSRRRLDVDTIDVFQLHAVPLPGRETEQALGALDELKHRGVIRAAGVSVAADTEAGLRLIRTGRIDVLQVYYNLLHQGAALDLFAAAEAAGVGIVAAIPLEYGFLSGRYTRKTVFAKDDWRCRLTRDEISARVERVEQLRFLTDDGKRTMVEAALQFAIAPPAVATTIPGFRNPEQVEGLLRALTAPPLSDIELARARELGGVLSKAPGPRA